MPVINGGLLQDDSCYSNVCRLCAYLAETKESCTQGYPGLYTEQYLAGWTYESMYYPADLLEQPEMVQRTRIGPSGMPLICDVPVEVTITCLERLGYLVEGERDLILARLTLELMGD